MSFTWLRMAPKCVLKWSQNGFGNGLESGLVFELLFGAKKGPKMDPKIMFQTYVLPNYVGLILGPFPY